ncbi:MAG: hypothetical protein OSB55_06085 [Verrucomicrobiota bacterium]|nr:hypothetical protein [Verrucomicrobiota bacterium]
MSETSSDSRAMIRPGRLLALLLLGLGAVPSLHAQYEVKSGVFNWLSNRVPENNPDRIAPVGPYGTPSGDPTITPQYSNAVESSASAGPIPTSTGYPSSVDPDTGTGITLQRASVGTTFASGVPRYFFGDEITPPTTIVSLAGVETTITDPATYWRSEPVRPGEIITNPSGTPPVDFKTGETATVATLPEGTLTSYYYSAHARRVFAHTPGTVEVTWRSSVPDDNNNYLFYKERFTVSSATSAPIRTMFWTEKSFNGPRIVIPSGRIVTVNPVFSNVFPATVPEEYVVVGSSTADPDAEATQVLRTLWYEKNNGLGELHAYNLEGRIFVEYLGTLQEDGSHEFLGADIVNIQQSLQPNTLTVELGNEIRPQPDETLVASPVVTSAASEAAYYGSNPRPDGSLAYFAERENDIEDRVTFYWMETKDAWVSLIPGTSPGLAIDWPKHLNKYLQVWPSDVARFAHYTVGLGGSSVATGTGLKFEGGKVPTIIHQDSPNGEGIIDTVSQRFIVNLGSGGDQLNRTLLKFTGDNGGVWYVPLMTQSDGRADFLDGEGSSPASATAYVGERLVPPSPDYFAVGYVAEGTSYSPNAYIDPFANGVEGALKGAIIPVNALEGDENLLTVWWFKKIPAKSAEFSDFYTPAKIGRYTVDYRKSNQVVHEDFDAGASGWTNNTTSTGPDGKFLGPYGIAPNAATEKIFAITNNEGKGTVVSFTFHRIDSWDSEFFKVFINGNTVINRNYGGEVTENAEGTAVYGDATYSWWIVPVENGYGNYTGGVSADQKFKIAIKIVPHNGHSLASVKVGFGSTLNQAASEEAFAIDDFAIEVPLPQIVMASNLGTESLPSAVSSGSIYNQPDLLKPGYNPNEEHALMLGGRGYALRDDLNITSGASFTSLPRVLIQYTDPADNRPAISVFEVVRESPAYSFSYPVTAATILGSPMPLPLLPLPVDSNGQVTNIEVKPGGVDQDPPVAQDAPSSYTPFTYKDRKGYDWVYRGPHAGGNPSLGMQFYYTMRADYHIPGMATQPAPGTILPYLRPKNPDGTFVGDPVSGTPLTVLYFPKWPDSPPTLNIGETLALPKRGLPAVRGQTSARILYQQSIANTGTITSSVTLHDPTRAKTVLLNSASVGLTQLPVSLKTTMQNGKTYFQLAQPHLQQRFYLNPNLGNIGGLELIGEFVDEIAGEDYLNLNALSPADVSALKGLADLSDPDKIRWDKAIDALTTTVETFKEDPSKRGTYIVDSTKTKVVGTASLPEISFSDTAIDSYALTAPGKGSGYVTLLFGDGQAFTPQGEPVAMQVIKVIPQLYKGDLKKLSASNPLDEQTTLRHSGDFAAHPELYDFEWSYSYPVNGMAPPTYEYSMVQVIGTTATKHWFMLANPAGNPSEQAPLTYPTNEYELSRSIQINNESYPDGSGNSGQILKSVSGLNITDSVPDEVIFSASLDPTDGFVLHVNGVPAVAYQLPFGANVPGNLTPEAPRSGLASDGLAYQFSVNPSFFRVGSNTIEVALYSSRGVSSPSSLIDFRVDVPQTADKVDDPGSPWQQATGTQTNTIVIGGSAGSALGDPLLVFSDAYFTMRYKAKDSADLVTGSSWSAWMEPKLVESWVKRVLDGINPFNQRQTDLYNNPISTDVSILTQAGKRWEGDVALSLADIDDFGLIEIYETVLNRVKTQSLDAGVTTDSVNSTLLLAAGYLNDLYMTLGNEAWDDAQNPTILIDGQLGVDHVNSARFSFEGQLATMMDETLTLLRGRDDFLSPGVTTTPAYNRLYWNYTNGINSGEPIYAVNYDIKEKSGGPYADGTLDASDAYYMFPQGHGDAYGHYLTAIKGYYKLLTSPIFTWIPMTEGVDVLGQTVQVDYQDERKFAAAAAALARTGADVLDFTARSKHEDGDDDGWSAKRDGKFNKNTGRTRHWGTDEWSSRAFQGAYYNWVSANAMLPDVDHVNEGIQKIDRTTVPEINELISSANKIFTLSSYEQAHLNPLGLTSDAMAFDISPSELAAGKSHFEQVYDRATQAALNAKNAFDQAGKMNQLLRQQNTSLDEYNDAVSRQERAYEYQLITIFGTPYAGDVGPGKLYEQGYVGPDLYHPHFIDRPSPLIATDVEVTVNFKEPINHDPFKEWSMDNVYNRINDPLQYVTRSYKIVPSSIAQFSDTVANGLGKRSQTGDLQAALLDSYQAQVNLRDSNNTFSVQMRRFEREYQLFAEIRRAYNSAQDAAAKNLDDAAAMNKTASILSGASKAYEISSEYIDDVAKSIAEAGPTVVGFANDPTSIMRSISLNTGAIASFGQKLMGMALEAQIGLLQAQADDLRQEADQMLEGFDVEASQKQHIIEFERQYDLVLSTAFEMSRRLTELQRSTERVSRLYANANHILSERETFRQRAASVIQGYRTRDTVYRNFRNAELSQYKGLFDLAQTFSYLTAKAYDYETGLLNSAEGRSYLDRITQTYSIGNWDGTNPIEGGRGDPGIASVLGGLRDDWAVVKGRLGINNPDANGTAFSLRQELFRIRTDLPTADDDLLWKQVLQQHIMSNVMNDPDVAIHCNNISKADGSWVPGFVIPFATTIQPGLNFFGWPLAAGDHAYSQSNFATKINASGLLFSGYIGMDPFAVGTPGAGGPASSDPNALSATPYAYLIPAGVDTMLAPPLGDTNTLRSWVVKDQAIPLPKNLGATAFSAVQFFTPQGSLNEQLWITRKHPAFRAVNDPAYFYSTMPLEFTNSRLIGRSVWNSQWKIVIPAYSLLNNEQAGIDRFVQSVKDIKLFLRTYSHSGN